MKKEYMYALVGVVVGGLLTYIFTMNQISTRTAGTSQTNQSSKITMNHNSSRTMSEMNTMLTGKTGDEFDMAFLSAMIDHHKGAIDMANQAKQNAKHDEIKKMADDIISAQTTEINQMREWQKAWGYTQ